MENLRHLFLRFQCCNQCLCEGRALGASLGTSATCVARRLCRASKLSFFFGADATAICCVLLCSVRHSATRAEVITFNAAISACEKLLLHQRRPLRAELFGSALGNSFSACRLGPFQPKAKAKALPHMSQDQSSGGLASVDLCSASNFGPLRPWHVFLCSRSLWPLLRSLPSFTRPAGSPAPASP